MADRNLTAADVDRFVGHLASSAANVIVEPDERQDGVGAAGDPVNGTEAVGHYRGF